MELEEPFVIGSEFRPVVRHLQRELITFGVNYDNSIDLDRF